MADSATGAEQTLFIDARKLGTLIDRVHRELTDEDIQRLADTYHAWRGDKDCRKQVQGHSRLLQVGQARGDCRSTATS